MLFQSRGLLLFLISVCFFVCTITSAALTAPETFDSNFQKGKRYFDAGNYQEALRYLSEATRLEPKNQQGHSLAGVAYTKLGKWGDARREFEIVVRLNQNSPEGKQAQNWLKRLQQPINILILPFIDLSNATQKYGRDNMFNITSAFYNTLSKFLSDSRLYNITIPTEGSELFNIIIHDNSKFSNIRDICQHANKNGAKIIAVGFIDDFNFKDTPPHSANMKITIKIYSTKDCRLIHSVTDSGSFDNVAEGQLVDGIRRTLNIMFDRMFKEINAKLI